MGNWGEKKPISGVISPYLYICRPWKINIYPKKAAISKGARRSSSQQFQVWGFRWKNDSGTDFPSKMGGRWGKKTGWPLVANEGINRYIGIGWGCWNFPHSLRVGPARKKGATQRALKFGAWPARIVPINSWPYFHGWQPTKKRHQNESNGWNSWRWQTQVRKRRINFRPSFTNFSTCRLAIFLV